MRDELEQRVIEEIKRLKKHLKFNTVPLYKESKKIIELMHDIAYACGGSARVFKNEGFNNCRSEACKELQIRFSIMILTYESQDFLKKAPIRAEFQYEYNRYKYTVYKGGICSLFDRYKYSFSSESAPNTVDKSLAEMIATCMIIELYSALKYIYPNKYRGEKLNEII